MRLKTKIFEAEIYGKTDGYFIIAESIAEAEEIFKKQTRKNPSEIKIANYTTLLTKDGVGDGR